MVPQGALLLQARRLLKQDSGTVRGLYAGLGRDGAWAQNDALELILRHGELWGGFRARGMTICGGICPTNAPLPLAQAVCDTQLVLPHTQLVLPPAGSADDMWRFTEILCARANLRAGESNTLAALVGVKSGGSFVSGCFAAGLQLVAVRPLVALRPHYLFLQKSGVQIVAKKSIMIPLQDTLRVSRLLEEGWRGVAQWGGALELQWL